MVRIVFRFVVGVETYVVTLNAWPNVDILVYLEKRAQARNTYLLTYLPRKVSCLQVSIM